MIFDTDVLIWYLRGNPRAAVAIDESSDRKISAVTLMELYQGARDKRELKTIGDFFYDYSFSVLPITENISHRASIYVEQFCLGAHLQMADALIAATSIEHRDILYTANAKHYKVIQELAIKVFKPE